MNISIENNLKKFKDNNIIIEQLGFIESHFKLKNFEYKIKYDILKLYDKNSENFITINLNQLYNTIYEQEKLTLYLDNDTIITLEIKR